MKKKRDTLVMRAMLEVGIRNLTKKKIPNDGYLISLYDWWDDKSYDKFQVDIIHDTRIHDDPYIMVYYFPKGIGTSVYYLGPVFVDAETGKVKKS